MAGYKKRKPTKVLEINLPLGPAGGGGRVAGRKGKTVKEVEKQGGPLSRKLSDREVKNILEDHGYRAVIRDNGGVRAYEPIRKNLQGNMDYRLKGFREGTTLRTLRNWLGY